MWLHASLFYFLEGTRMSLPGPWPTRENSVGVPTDAEPGNQRRESVKLRTTIFWCCVTHWLSDLNGLGHRVLAHCKTICRALFVSGRCVQCNRQAGVYSGHVRRLMRLRLVSNFESAAGTGPGRQARPIRGGFILVAKD